MAPTTEFLKGEDIARKVITILGFGTARAQKAGYATRFDQLIREGFPVKAGDRLKAALNLTDNQLADTLGLSPKTLQRKKKAHERLSRIESDILFRNARILAIAIEVFEDEKRAAEWMRKPQFGLGERIPFEMIQTEAGTREVEDLLGRMEYGIYS
ncbi:MAG: DUF2384 domain-containing protein [Nitrospiraceae bacterium]|nr:DUF2384 domain-containing protein [Nitrospiraceae bacterium]